MTYSQRHTISRLFTTAAAVLLSSLLPTAQAFCFRDNNDNGFFDNGDRRCLSTGARIGIAIGSAVLIIIIIFLIYYYTRSRSFNSGGNVIITQGPAPAFVPPPVPPPSFAPPPGPPPSFAQPPPLHGSFQQQGYPQQSYAPQQGFVDNGAQYSPPQGPPPAASFQAGPSDAPPQYAPLPEGSTAAAEAKAGYGGSKAYNQV